MPKNNRDGSYLRKSLKPFVITKSDYKLKRRN